MKKTILHIILLLLVAIHCDATNLNVIVKDKVNATVLTGVNIKVSKNKSEKDIFLANTNGNIILKDIVYPVKITCSYTGYESKSVTILKKDVQNNNGHDEYMVYLEKSIGQINELVVTAQVIPVMAKQSIYKVNSISTTEINQRAAVSLNDVLNYEMNNFISNDNILGSSVNIGGIGGQNVKVLVNGIPIMGRENGNIDMSQLSLNNIKRVEMIQGPMSVMYGSNALGGVINLITATPKKKYSFNLRSYNESIGRYNVSGNIGFNKKKHQLQFSAARNFFSGWTPSDSVDRYQLWKPKTQYTSDLQYWTSFNKVKLNYFGSYLNEKITNKGEPVINPYEGYAFDEYYRTNRIVNSVSATIPLDSTDQLSFNNSYQHYKRIKNRLKKDLVTLNEFETQNIGDQDTTSFNDLNLRGTYTSSRFKKLDLMAGYEYTYETGRSYKLADYKQTMSEIGIFASALYKMKKLQVQPSFRWTYNNRFNASVSPAFHVKYDIDAQTQWRASYARGFRAPTLKEMHLQFVDQNHTIIGNSALKPEIGDHIETGFEHQYSAGKATMNYSVNAYYNSIQNLIALAVYNNHGTLRQYANIENYKNWVLNIRGKYAIRDLNINSGAGIIFVEKTNITPQHSIFEYTFNGSYLIRKIGTSFNFNYKFNSKQPVLTIDQQFLYTSPLHIANLSVQRSFFKKSLQIQLGVKNLFNEMNASLSNSLNTQSSGHSSSGTMMVFPARSYFADLSYSF